MAADSTGSDWGIHGKHPAFGDFVTAGLCASADTHLLPWLGAALSSVREALGDRWNTRWDSAPPLRFWIGGGVWDGAALCGVMMPSRDKVGRRYPLMLVAETRQPAPTIDPDQTPYEDAETQLRLFASDAAALRTAMAARITPAPLPPADPLIFWAANPALSPADLMDQLAATDFQRASHGRSYWWTARTKDRASAVTVADRLPGADALAWLIAGLPADAGADTTEIPLQEVADVSGH